LKDEDNLSITVSSVMPSLLTLPTCTYFRAFLYEHRTAMGRLLGRLREIPQFSCAQTVGALSNIGLRRG